MLADQANGRFDDLSPPGNAVHTLTPRCSGLGFRSMRHVRHLSTKTLLLVGQTTEDRIGCIREAEYRVLVASEFAVDVYITAETRANRKP